MSVILKTVFGDENCSKVLDGEKITVVEGYDYLERKFNTDDEANAYMQGLADCDGWFGAYVLAENDVELVEVRKSEEA